MFNLEQVTNNFDFVEKMCVEQHTTHIHTILTFLHNLEMLKVGEKFVQLAQDAEFDI